MKHRFLDKQNMAQRDDLCKEIMLLSPGRRWDVQIKEWRNVRSVRQNSRYFAMVSDIAEATNLTVDDMHEVLKHCNLGYVDVEAFGENFTLLQRSRVLEKDPFNRFTIRCEAWGAERGVKFSLPDGWAGES